MEATFNAWEVTRYGAPEVLTPIARAVPTLTAGHVLIHIRASAVSRADGLMRAVGQCLPACFWGSSGLVQGFQEPVLPEMSLPSHRM